LKAVHRGGVAEPNVADDLPGVAVLDEVPAAADRQSSVVGAGNDPVTDAGSGSVAQGNACLGYLPGFDPVASRPQVHAGDLFVGGGDDHAGLFGAHVGGPRFVGGVEHARCGAFVDPVVRLVEVQSRRVAVAQSQGGFCFGGVGEAV